MGYNIHHHGEWTVSLTMLVANIQAVTVDAHPIPLLIGFTLVIILTN